MPVGKRRLKGLADELELFQAHSAAAAEKNIDPVCGMELAPGEVAVKLSVEGVERVFCSGKCLRKFVAAPEKIPRLTPGSPEEGARPFSTVAPGPRQLVAVFLCANLWLN